ncbi:LppX_LprAFG lipoprotein [Flexivirga sp. ID2601S]|uniref:LppX_LprAFG lipoprotein n=1 Tax=Flexivirga aerilata TaxID=1656889 RepID=A0A849AK45_9MICO|nr:LppX_LprAFG lipoprotein [Flexivirga aerilata]NNG38770.1 LppX_LprAFG lipoprotein [Flexivirga aerilata]
MRRTLTATGTIAVAASLALTGCSGGGKKKSDAAASAAANPAAMLATAKKTLDETAGVHFKLTSQKVPDKATGLLSGEGDGSHAPAFKGSIKVQVPVAGAVDVPVVAVNGKVWAKTPLTPKMAQVDPKQFGAPDPAKIFATEGGFSSLLTATQKPKFGDKTRSGKDVVQTVTGTLPGTIVKKNLTIGVEAETYDTTYLITDSGELRSATLTGQFYSQSTDTSYTVELTKYGEQVTVSPPS